MQVAEMEVRIENIIEIERIIINAKRPEYNGVAFRLKSIYYSPKGEKLFEVDRGIVNMCENDTLCLSSPEYKVFIPVNDNGSYK